MHHNACMHNHIAIMYNRGLEMQGLRSDVKQLLYAFLLFPPDSNNEVINRTLDNLAEKVIQPLIQVYSTRNTCKSYRMSGF